MLGRDLQVVRDMDTANHQHLVFGDDLTFDICGQGPRLQSDTARIQRATQGAGESAAGGCYHVIERGGEGWILLRIEPVVLGDLRMDAECYRVFFDRKVGQSDGSLEPLYPDA